MDVWTSSLTLESLLKVNNLSEAQVYQQIGDHDLTRLAEWFNGKVEDYIEHEQFGLEPQKQVHVKSQKKVSKAARILLSYWKQKKAQQATFKALLELLLDINKGTVAQCVCKYVKTRQPSEDFLPPFEHIQNYPINGRIVLLVAVLLVLVLVLAIAPKNEIVDSYSLTVHQEEYLFDWEDNGFIIYFPQNSVEPQTPFIVAWLVSTVSK